MEALSLVRQNAGFKSALRHNGMSHVSCPNGIHLGRLTSRLFIRQTTTNLFTLSNQPPPYQLFYQSINSTVPYAARYTMFQNNGLNRNRPPQKVQSSISRHFNGGQNNYRAVQQRQRIVRVAWISGIGLVALLGYWYQTILAHQHDMTQTNPLSSTTVDASPKKKPSIIASFLLKSSPQQQQQQHVDYFRQVAMELARYSPADILYELNEYDPFGVRRVATNIQNAELQNNNQSIPLSQIQSSLFPCPSIMKKPGDNHDPPHNNNNMAHRLTYPDLRNMTKLAIYQQQMLDITTTDTTKHIRRQPSPPDTTTTTNNNNYFIFFQHLRKAGGTHFCTLAQQNIPKLYVPKYYCMPDYYWPPPLSKQQQQEHPCAGCLHRYSNTEIVQYLQSHKIAGNEWDTFRVTDHFQLPAIFMTSFRSPLHRFVSQYRFECVEARGCTAKTISAYWRRRRDLINIYTSTFSDINEQASFATSDTRVAAQQRSNAVMMAFDTLVQFHLVLVMELLPYSEQLVRDVLGFSDTSILSKRVRPHNSGKNYRTDSWTPEQYLTTEQYQKMSESLALDEILYDVARRIFLERLVCTTTTTAWPWYIHRKVSIIVPVLPTTNLILVTC